MNLLPLILLLNLAAEPATEIQSDPMIGGISTVITVNGAGHMLCVLGAFPPKLDLPQGPVPSEIGERYLKLFVTDPQTGLRGPSILGSYSFNRHMLSFSPAAMATPGYRYEAVLMLPGLPSTTSNIDIDPLPVPAGQTAVQTVYPTADQVPANLLKFYVYFSRPMRETADIFNHMHILDQTLGTEVEDPWRRQSMWSDDGKRLTVLIHPGRIKKGVNLREELGPVLRPDHRYTLVIDADILDADGRPLGREFRKHFQTLAEDASRPALDHAEITVAKDGVLYVDFKKTMDHALLARMIHVQDADGAIVQGVAKVFQGERCWTFTPAKPWKKERHTITVDEDLEDLSGNTPSRVFDADLENPDRGPIVLQRVFTP